MSIGIEKDVSLVESLLDQNRIDEAVGNLLKAVQQKPQDIELATLLATIVLERPERLEQVHMVWGQLLVTESQIADKLLELGVVLLTDGQYLMAQKAIESVLLYSTHPDSVFALIRFWNKLGYPRQERLYLLSLAEQNNHPSTFLMIANTFACEHDVENAVLWWVSTFRILSINMLIQAKPLLNWLGGYREDYGYTVHEQLGLSKKDFWNLHKIAKAYFEDRLLEFKNLVTNFLPIKINGMLHVVNFDRVIKDEKIDSQIMSLGSMNNGIYFVINLLQQHVACVALEKKSEKKLHLHFSMNLNNGGTERHMLRTLIGSNSDDVNIIVTCQSKQSTDSRNLLDLANKNGIQVYTVTDFRDDMLLLNKALNTGKNKDGNNIIRKYFDTGMVSACMNSIKHFSPDKVSVWGLYIYKNAGIASYLCNVGNISLHLGSQLVNLHPGQMIRGQANNKFEAEICRLLINNSRFKMFINTRSIWTGFQKNFSMENTSERVRIKYNPYPQELINSKPEINLSTLKQRLNIPTKSQVLGIVSRLDRNKNILLWLTTASLVAKKNDNLHFVIVGDGVVKEFAIDFATKIGIINNCHFVGEQSKNLKIYFQLMSAVLLTSDSEGLPNILLEAQALGIPVVARDVGGIREAVWHEQTGFVIDSKNPKVLAEAVESVLTDKYFREQVKEYGPKFIKALSASEAFPVDQADNLFTMLRSR